MNLVLLRRFSEYELLNWFSIAIILDRSINESWSKKDAPLLQGSCAGTRATLSQTFGLGHPLGLQCTRRTCELNILENVWRKSTGLHSFLSNIQSVSFDLLCWILQLTAALSRARCGRAWEVLKASSALREGFYRHSRRSESSPSPSAWRRNSLKSWSRQVRLLRKPAQKYQY